MDHAHARMVASEGERLQLNPECIIVYLAAVYRPFAPYVTSAFDEYNSLMRRATNNPPSVDKGKVVGLCAVWEANSVRLNTTGQALSKAAASLMRARKPKPTPDPKPTQEPFNWTHVALLLLVTAAAFLVFKNATP